MPERGRGVILAAAFLAMATIAAGLVAAQGLDPAQDLEARANALKRVSSRLICQCSCNMVLAECSHQTCPFALPEREKIVAMIAQGMSDDAIVAAYVERYGSVIRATPPTEGSLYDRIGWFLPYIGLSAGLVVVLAYLRRFTAKAQPAAALASPAGGDAYRSRVEKDVGPPEAAR